MLDAINCVLTGKLASNNFDLRFTDSNEGFVHVAYKQYLNQPSLGIQISFTSIGEVGFEIALSQQSENQS